MRSKLPGAVAQLGLSCSWGLGLRVQCLGSRFRVQDPGFRVQSLGFRVWVECIELRVEGWGRGQSVQGSGFWVQVLRLVKLQSFIVQGLTFRVQQGIMNVLGSMVAELVFDSIWILPDQQYMLCLILTTIPGRFTFEPQTHQVLPTFVANRLGFTLFCMKEDKKHRCKPELKIQIPSKAQNQNLNS